MIKKIKAKGINTMSNKKLNLNNWKVEELKLLKLKRYTGMISEVEGYSLEDKISILENKKDNNYLKKDDNYYMI